MVNQNNSIKDALNVIEERLSIYHEEKGKSKSGRKAAIRKSALNNADRVQNEIRHYILNRPELEEIAAEGMTGINRTFHLDEFANHNFFESDIYKFIELLKQAIKSSDKD